MYRVIHGRARRAVGFIGRTLDSFSLGLPFGLVGCPIILPYRKFGTSDRVRVVGRVVEDRGVVAAAHMDSTPANLWLTFKRYAAYEVPEAQIGIRFGAEHHTVRTNRQGFFEVGIEPTASVRLPTSGIRVGAALETGSTKSNDLADRLVRRAGVARADPKFA